MTGTGRGGRDRDRQRCCLGWCPLFPGGAVGVEVPFARPGNALEFSLESLTLRESWWCGMPWGRAGSGAGSGNTSGAGNGAQGVPQSCRGSRQNLALHG